MTWRPFTRVGLAIAVALAAPVSLSAASPYDAYYDTYRLPDDQPVPDNDNYYTVPRNYPTDNDSYYSPPDYNRYDAPSGSPYAGGRTNCNTIGEMPSCGSD